MRTEEDLEAEVEGLRDIVKVYRDTVKQIRNELENKDDWDENLVVWIKEVCDNLYERFER